jgi:hypothetical protein
MAALDTSGFTGTATWWRHPLARLVTYTDGARYVAETAGAYWLLDKIATEGPRLGEPFQVWTLDVAKLTITITDGNGGEIAVHGLDFTDFPEPGIELWFTDNTILLPSEY